MTLEIISQSISTEVWDWARIQLAIPGSAVGLAKDCATGLVCYVCDSKLKDQDILSQIYDVRSDVLLNLQVH